MVEIATACFAGLAMTAESQMQDTRCKNGFTLAELLIALVVTSVILAAVAALAYAVTSANDVTDDTSQKQAQLRYATLRISELIRYCKLIYDTPDNDIVVWKIDNNGDNIVDSNELVYIETGPGRDYIQLREADKNPVVLIPQCSNVEFGFDEPLVPPTLRKFVSVSFDLVENGIERQYQISAGLRGWAGNLLDGSGNIISDDD